MHKSVIKVVLVFLVYRLKTIYINNFNNNTYTKTNLYNKLLLSSIKNIKNNNTSYTVKTNPVLRDFVKKPTTHTVTLTVKTKNNKLELTKLFKFIILKKILGFSPLYKNFFKVLAENYYNKYNKLLLNNESSLNSYSYNSIQLKSFYGASYQYNPHTPKVYNQYFPKTSIVHIINSLQLLNPVVNKPKNKNFFTKYINKSFIVRLGKSVYKHNFLYKTLYTYLKLTKTPLIKINHPPLSRLNDKLNMYLLNNKLNLITHLSILNTLLFSSSGKLTNYKISANLKNTYNKILNKNNLDRFFLKKSTKQNKYFKSTLTTFKQLISHRNNQNNTKFKAQVKIIHPVDLVYTKIINTKYTSMFKKFTAP
jgi:hypothetical protein